MNDESDPANVSLDRFDLANQVDIVCDAYEQAWRSGVEPEIPAYLAGFSGGARETLLTELLALDWELRASRGDAVSRDDYLARYPEFAQVIERVNVSTLAGSPSGERLTHADTVGHRFAQFELLARLGEGASGTVWKARDTSLRRLVALKLPRLQDMTEAERARFRREGQACAQLHHPNIVAVYQVGDQHGRYYIASELIEGWNLRQWLDQQGRISHIEAVTLAAELADALQHSHEKGVIHRDLKPANVLIDKAGHPHLTDFGLARWTDQSIALTVEGHVVGTPAYMSPEQALGDTQAVDRRADVYGLGAIFYELLTGKTPFEGELASVIHQVINAEPVAPAKVDAKVPRDLETICMKAMQKSPADRYPSMRALADDLHRYLRGEPIAARRVGPLARAVRFVRRRKALSGMVAACLLALCALAAVVVLAEKNYELQGYRTVSITTEPPGARVAFVPLSLETGEPELYRKILAPGVSPVEVDLLPGDYFVVAAMADGRFHEVYRHVPKPAATWTSFSPHAAYRLLEGGITGLASVAIPSLEVHHTMTRVEGNEYFSFGFQATRTSVPYTVNVRPFFVDNTEFSLAEEAERGAVTTSANVAEIKSFDEAVSKAEALGKRLPTEAEYEYLATNGGTTRYPWGDEWPAKELVLSPAESGDAFGPVGTPAFDKIARYPAVKGLCSNKAEWVMPQLIPSLLDPSLRPAVILETARVYRGGSAATIAGDPRVTPEDRDPRQRGEATGKLQYPGLGFRCVRSVEPLVGYEEFE